MVLGGSTTHAVPVNLDRTVLPHVRYNLIDTEARLKKSIMVVCGSDGVRCPEMSSVFPGRDMRLPTDISRPDKYNT